MQSVPFSIHCSMMYKKKKKKKKILSTQTIE